MRRELASGDTVNVVADVAVRSRGAAFEAALIAERASVVGGHVECVGGEKAVSGIRMGGVANGFANGFKGFTLDIKEVCVGGGR